MATDRIDSIIDNISVEAEIVKVEKRLAELVAKIESMPKAKIFADGGNTKQLSQAQRELSTVLDQLKVKNLELTAAIKEQQLVEKQAAVAARQAAEERKAAAAAQREADRQAKIDAKQKIADEKAAAAAAQVAAQEKLRALQIQKEKEAELLSIQKERAKVQPDLGTFDIPQGSGQAGTAGLKKTSVKEAAFVPANATEENLLFLTKTETALKANQAVQKDLGDQLKRNEISQEQYNEKIVEARAAELEYKKQIQLTNAELKARTNADFAIQGSIDAARAQNALLTQQRNAIPVGEGATPEDVARLKELNAEIDKNNDLIDKNNDLLGRQKINIGNYPQNAFSQTFKTLNNELEAVQGKLVSGNFRGAELDALTAKFNVLSNATKLTGKEFSSTGAQSKAFMEAGVQIGQVYGKDSQFFKQFSEGVRSGAANIKGMANEVAGVATKGKGFLNFLNLAWSGIRRLSYLIPGLGIGGMILLLLGPLQAAGAAIVRTVKKSMDSMTELAKEAKKKLEELTKASNQINAEYIRSSTASILKLENLRNVITDTSKTEKERLAALRDYNKIADSNNRIDEKQINNLNLINDSISRQIDLIEKRALASAGEKIVTDAAVKLLLAQQKAEEKARADQLIEDKYSIETAEGQKTDQYFKTLEREGAIRAKIAKDAGVKQAQAELDAAKQIALRNQNINGYVGDFDSGNKGLKKSHEDSERLADEFRKKDLEALAKFTKDELTILKNRYKDEADDQNSSMEERLKSVEDYYKVSAQLIANDVKAQEDALKLEIEVANKRAGKIEDPKKRADALNAIEKYRVDKLKTIQQDAMIATTALEKELYSENSTIAEQSYQKIQKVAEEAYKFITEQAKIAFQNQKDSIDINKDDQLLQLEKDLAAGRIKNIEDYNNKKQVIEEKADIAQKRLDLERIKEQETTFEALYGKKNLALIKAYKDLEVEINTSGNKKILDSDRDLQEKRKELRNQLEDTFQGIVENSFDAQQAKDDAELKHIDAKAQKEIDAINASTLAQEEKARRITAIEKQADFQKQQLEKRQQSRDLARAKFERAASIARVIQNVADAVSKDLLGNKALIPFDIAIGAAQIALIVSQPLPKFAKGTKNAPKGSAIVGEQGSELIVDKAGKMFLTPSKPTLVDLAGGEQIFKHDITKDMMNHFNLLHILQKVQSSKQVTKIENGYNEKIYRELKALNGKPPVIIHNSQGVESSAWYYKHFKN